MAERVRSAGSELPWPKSSPSSKTYTPPFDFPSVINKHIYMIVYITTKKTTSCDGRMLSQKIKHRCKRAFATARGRRFKWRRKRYLRRHVRRHIGFCDGIMPSQILCGRLYFLRRARAVAKNLICDSINRRKWMTHDSNTIATNYVVANKNDAVAKAYY